MIHAPNSANVLQGAPITELLHFLLWLDYLRAGLVPGMPTWRDIDKPHLAALLLDKMQDATSYLVEEIDHVATGNDLAALSDGLRLLMQCRRLLTALRAEER